MSAASSLFQSRNPSDGGGGGARIVSVCVQCRVPRPTNIWNRCVQCNGATEQRWRCACSPPGIHPLAVGYCSVCASVAPRGPVGSAGRFFFHGAQPQQQSQPPQQPQQQMSLTQAVVAAAAEAATQGAVSGNRSNGGFTFGSSPVTVWQPPGGGGGAATVSSSAPASPRSFTFGPTNLVNRWHPVLSSPPPLLTGLPPGGGAGGLAAFTPSRGDDDDNNGDTAAREEKRAVGSDRGRGDDDAPHDTIRLSTRGAFQWFECVGAEVWTATADGDTTTMTPCTICMEPVSSDQQHVLQTPCAHVFHDHCLSRWLARYRRCPVCRAGLDARVHLTYLLRHTDPQDICNDGVPSQQHVPFRPPRLPVNRRTTTEQLLRGATTTDDNNQIHIHTDTIHVHHHGSSIIEEDVDDDE